MNTVVQLRASQSENPTVRSGRGKNADYRQREYLTEGEIAALLDTAGNSRKVFANQEAAQDWLEEIDPEGGAFEYEVRSNSSMTAQEAHDRFQKEVGHILDGLKLSP